MNITNDYNKFYLHGSIAAHCGAFLRSYKPLEKTVPFSHLRKDAFSVRKSFLPALRTAGVVWLAALLLFPPPAIPAEVLSLERLTAKTQEIYEKTTDLKARFVQEVTIRSMKKTEREEGTVHFKNPRMMLWDYQKPKAKKLVINARKAWLYVPEDRMVYVQNAEEVYRSRMAVRFLSGLGKLSEDFHIRFTGDKTLDEQGNYLLTLTAKEAEGGVERLFLTIDGKNFHISQFSFTDAYGNATRLRLSDIRINTGVPDSLFDFKPPAGVEIVTMPQ